MLYNGAEVTRRGSHGEALLDDSFLLLLHAGAAAVDFRLPELAAGCRYRTVLDTAETRGAARAEVVAGDPVHLVANSAVLLAVIV
jgi:glycogen operon protein